MGIPPEIKDLISAMKHYRSGHGFLNNIEQDIDQEVVKGIGCPTLIVHSKNDNSVPFEHALHAHKMINNSILQELNNEWGHLFWIGHDTKEAIHKTIEFLSPGFTIPGNL